MVVVKCETVKRIHVNFLFSFTVETDVWPHTSKHKKKNTIKDSFTKELQGFISLDSCYLILEPRLTDYKIYYFQSDGSHNLNFVA